MPEQTPCTLNHFAFYRFNETYWQCAADERHAFQQQWVDDLRQAAFQAHLYQVFPAEEGSDLLLWSAQSIEASCDTSGFFDAYARATNPHRRFVRPTHVLWGYTRPSEYTRTRSSREMDPFTAARKPYLVLYPFVKTTEWYLMSPEARQGMMNEHIRIGKQYPDISQLLLYSFGVQDQEFVVVYEMEDLTQFSRLVQELRSTEARRFTARDAPLHAALYHPMPETLALF
jgi:chlorite dismutase